MKKLLLITFLATVMTGCATTSKHSVGLIQNEDVNTALAKESSTHIKGTLPVAKTTLIINEKTQFGKLLSENLRQEGFGVIEEKSNDEVVNALKLKYVTDEISGETGVYRILLDYDNRVFSRLYELTDRSLSPMGGWSVITYSKGVDNVR